MTQSWLLPLATGDKVGPSVISKLVPAMEALRTLNGGSSAPTTTDPYMLWQEEASDREIHQRNAGDTLFSAILAANVRNHQDEYFVELQGGIAAATNFPLHAPGQNWRALELVILSDTATSGSSSGATEWTFQVRNITESLDLLASPWSTGDAELASKTPKVITFDQNQAISADDYLELQIGKTGSPTDLSSAMLRIGIRGHLRGA